MRLRVPLALFSALALTVLTAVTAAPTSLVEARAGFATKLLRELAIGEAPEPPPADAGLDLITYTAPLGRNAAYVSGDPRDGKKHPVVIWLVGGFSNSISPLAWTPGPKENDQSAAGFRAHGILMMYPSLRGGNQNPGYLEAFYGEVDDVLAAARHLRSLPYVDPERIYLGGHSTGGTLALLVAAAAPKGLFRAVLALGPVEDVVGYGADVLPFDLTNSKEGSLRAPMLWLADIKSPTLIAEGTQTPSNLSSLRVLKKRSTNPLIRFYEAPNHTHFNLIAPMIEQFSQNILRGIAAATEPKHPTGDAK